MTISLEDLAPYVTSGTTTTTVTTYKYHYIGSQITTIEIDQTQTVDDGEETPVTTTTKDDEIRIHLGANSRPISFEYYTENQGTQQTTSATYYYHYDLHGNVIRVTNSSGTTVIQYTYDQLGTIVSETNPNSIESSCVVAILPDRGDKTCSSHSAQNARHETSSTGHFLQCFLKQPSRK